MTLLQTAGTATDLLQAGGRIAGLAFAAGVVTAACAFLYRWYADQRAPLGMIVLVGLSVIAVYLNTRTALGQVVGGAETVSLVAAFFNIGAVVAGAFASAIGQRTGDRLAVDVFATTGVSSIDGEVSRIVKAVGRSIVVETPDEIDDIVGYDPASEETKSKIAGRSFVFPRGLTVDQLRERLVARLKTDYDVGHVDVELEADGTVSHLALGRRVAGIGPTLPPESVAMAIRADPAYAAGPGDVVQIWTTDGGERRCNAEIRATAGDVVTVVVDAADASKLDDDERYRLVTLSTDARPDREFASLLRAADETMGVVEIGVDSTLDGAPIGALDATVLAVFPVDHPVETLPSPDRLLEAGESVSVLATPDTLRTVETAATPPTE
jgi:hypothetical protein